MTIRSLAVFQLFILCIAATAQEPVKQLGTENRGVAATGVQQIFRTDDRVAIVGNTFADLMHLNGYFETLLRHRCADKSIMMRNLGWAGDTLSNRARPTNFASEDKSLSDFQTDVIVVCFGMGESFDGVAGLKRFEENLRRLLGHYQKQKYNNKSSPRLILVSPIAHEDVETRRVNVAERNRDLGSYTGLMRKIALELEIPFIDLFGPTKALIDESGGSRLTTNGIHLTPYGYWAASQILVEQLGLKSQPVRLTIDLTNQQLDADGGNMSRFVPAENGWSWSLESRTWPSPPPPSGIQVHPSLKRFLDIVVVKGLQPGNYRLDVEAGKPISATAQQWAAGVPVISSPRHAAMEAYRSAVNDKNLSHFHGWRSLNQVHIVGQRKTSPSGQDLPGELIQWKKQADEADEQLTVIARPSQHESWSLKPAK